ncbi:amidase signature enzyme [Pyrenochaeta sp. DS3sAY3a]|nr:amidase signature enzyme [Pyrenochaeta sp. DS3sAY3a]
MSDNERSTPQFFNYPTPKDRDAPFEAAPPAKNPIFKGLPLHYLSTVVANAPLIPYLLWNNAGFGSLRKCTQLEGVDPRYDPTVIPLPTPGDKAPASYTANTTFRLPPGSKPDTRFYTIKDYNDAYSSGTLTPSDVIEVLLPLIRRDVATRSPYSAAFMESRVDEIKQAAVASTQRWKQGKPLGVLDGVPFGVKDDLDIKGYKRYIGTTHDYTGGGAKETSWCAKKVEDEGAILVGKLTMHELGMDTTNNNPNWGTPLNPYNNSYYPGGSSGGAASAVGHGLIPFAIGSDGGGSIRIPANYCGLYGLKPSHCRVSTAPMPDAGKSVTVRGPLASNMCDLELAYRVLAQPDPSTYPSSQFSVPRPLSNPRTKVIGLPRAWFDSADPNVQEPCHAALQYFVSECNYRIVDITIPLLREGQLAHAMTILAEGASSSKIPVSQLTAPNKVLMTVARQTPATDFLLAQRVRNVLMEHLANLFRAHPGLVIVTPTTPNAGWPIDTADLPYGVSNANMQLRNMTYVWLANFTGVPCIQFPVGYVDAVQGEGRVPVGLSGQGEWGSEDALIEFGFDGEKWLHEGFKGGKVRPTGWVDVLKGG